MHWGPNFQKPGLVLLRNDEMTMNRLFTHEEFEQPHGTIVDLPFDERYGIWKRIPWKTMCTGFASIIRVGGIRPAAFVEYTITPIGSYNRHPPGFRIPRSATGRMVANTGSPLDP